MTDDAGSVAQDAVGPIPYRMALAGGWIDQPFVSRLNPRPPGSMVVACLEPEGWVRERSGMASGTRRVAQTLWSDQLPDRPPMELVRELYTEENRDLDEPSGSQDMIGLVYPGICRLDYDAAHEDGIFPSHIEQCNDPDIAGWLGQVIQIIPVGPRPRGYAPLGEKHLDPDWIQKLGQSGADCFDAILARDVTALGASMNDCMTCWATLLPETVRHPSIPADLPGILAHYQSRYPGAMYSGCGGGYLYIASEEPVRGAITATVRIKRRSS
jgi:hypothetical protein